MIYAYNFDKKLYMDLLTYLPVGKILYISDIDKLNQLVKKDDFVLFWGWSNKDRILQNELKNRKAILFPEPDISFRIGNRINQLKELEKITKFNIERVFFVNNSNLVKQYQVPNFKNSSKVVVKIGNEHQGKFKQIKNTYDFIYTSENVIFEEFVENARSIRICLITKNPKDIFIIEYINSNNWIKNINPQQEIVYSYDERYKLNIEKIDEIIEDALNIYNFYNHPFLGIDYVVNDTTIGFLEVNDMIGLADDERIYEKAKKFFRKLVRTKTNCNCFKK